MHRKDSIMDNKRKITLQKNSIFNKKQKTQQNPHTDIVNAKVVTKFEEKKILNSMLDTLFYQEDKNNITMIYAELHKKFDDAWTHVITKMCASFNHFNVLNKPLLEFLMKNPEVNLKWHHLEMPKAGLMFAVENDQINLFKLLILAYELTGNALTYELFIQSNKEDNMHLLALIATCAVDKDHFKAMTTDAENNCEQRVIAVFFSYMEQNAHLFEPNHIYNCVQQFISQSVISSVWNYENWKRYLDHFLFLKDKKLNDNTILYSVMRSLAAIKNIALKCSFEEERQLYQGEILNGVDTITHLHAMLQSGLSVEEQHPLLRPLIYSINSSNAFWAWEHTQKQFISGELEPMDQPVIRMGVQGKK